MAFLTLRLNKTGLLDYAKAGRQAVQEIKKATRKVLNLGRTTARRGISSEFAVRTGFLRKQSRGMQTKVTVSRSEVKGVVSPIPRLMNIFERGATFAHGRGMLRPRPVVAPAAVAMQREAETIYDAVLRKVGT